MRLAIVCGGKTQLNNETPLRFVGESVDKVVTILETNGWICEPFKEATNTEDYKKILRKYSHIDELLFYYIGHGNGSKIATFEIFLQTNSLTIEQVIKATKDIYKPKKMALVIDACYSGHTIDGRIDDSLEILTSTDKDTKAFEQDSKSMSVFSYYFCEVFRVGIQEDSPFINLEQIRDFVLSDEYSDVDDAYYLPPRTGLVDKIIIGYNHKINNLKNKVITYYQNNYDTEKEQISTFRHDILRYYPRTKEEIYNSLKEANSLEGLFRVLVKDEHGSYLYCLLKYLDIEDEYLDTFIGNKECQEIKTKIDTIMVVVARNTNNSDNYHTADVYYGLDNELVKHKKHINECEWKVLYKKEIKEILEEILQLNCVPKIELQLILPIKLISSDFKNESVVLDEVEGIVNDETWGNQFNIITKFYSRLEDYGSRGNNSITLWQDNLEKYEQHLEKDNESKTYCSLTLDNISNFCDNDALLLLSEQSAIDDKILVKIYSLGIPFVVTSQEGKYIFRQHEEYSRWCESKLKDVKKSSYRFINEMPEMLHFLCDDGYSDFFLKAFQNVDKNDETDNFLGDEYE